MSRDGGSQNEVEGRKYASILERYSTQEDNEARRSDQNSRPLRGSSETFIRGSKYAIGHKKQSRDKQGLERIGREEPSKDLQDILGLGP